MPEILDDIELRSEEVQDILTKVPHWMLRWGSALLLLLLLLVLFLSWLIKYPDVIAANGVITTTTTPQKIYARTQGKIEMLFVKDEQLVEKGTILGIIENTADTKDVRYLKSILDTLPFNKQQLYFPIDELPVLLLGSIDSFFAEFENNYHAFMLNKTMNPYLNEAIANQVSLQELHTQLRHLTEQHELHRKELDLERKVLDRSTILQEKGVISEQELEKIQLQLINSERTFKMTQSRVSQLNENIAIAQKTIKSTKISKSREEITLFKKLLQSYSSLKKTLKDWENTYVLKSKIAGKVAFFDYWSDHQTVFQDDQVFSVIPTNNNQYIAKLEVPIQNSGKIKSGQQVHLMLANYPETEFGVLKGTIQHISVTANTEGQYVADVGLPQDLITSYNKPIRFQPEMVVTAEIITEDLRLIERFFYQFKKVFKNNH